MDRIKAESVKVGDKVRYVYDGIPAFWSDMNWCEIAGLKLNKVYTVRENYMVSFKLDLSLVDYVDIRKRGYCFHVEHFELYINPARRVVSFIKKLFIK